MFEKISFRVEGKVQGVCFRAYAQAAAKELHITGWVRNRKDGRVEGEAWGRPEAIEGYIQWLHSGSPYGRVDHVDVVHHEPEEECPSEFGIRY